MGEIIKKKRWKFISFVYVCVFLSECEVRLKESTAVCVVNSKTLLLTVSGCLPASPPSS